MIEDRAELAQLARERVRNGAERAALQSISGVLAAIVIQSYWPLVWVVINLPALALDRWMSRTLLDAATTPDAPLHMRRRLVALVYQGLSGNALGLILWFSGALYGPLLGGLYLVGGAANAVVTLRRRSSFMLAGALTSAAYFIGACAYSALGDHGPQAWAHYTPIVALPIFTAFAFLIWRHLRAGDAAERRAAENARLAQASAEEARAAKKIAVAGLATALAPVVDSARSLLDEDMSAAGREEALRACLDVGKGMLQDLVGLHATADPAALVRAIARAQSPAARERGIELFLDLPSTAPNVVRMDAPRVQRIALHLLANAVRATKHAGVRLRLESDVGDAGAPRFALTVSDAGEPISRRRLQRIMAGQDAGETAAERSLALCVDWAKHGDLLLRARTDEAGGNAFTLIFPVASAHESATAQA